MEKKLKFFLWFQFFWKIYYFIYLITPSIFYFPGRFILLVVSVKKLYLLIQKKRYVFGWFGIPCKRKLRTLLQTADDGSSEGWFPRGVGAAILLPLLPFSSHRCARQCSLARPKIAQHFFFAIRCKLFGTFLLSFFAVSFIEWKSKRLQKATASIPRLRGNPRFFTSLSHPPLTCLCRPFPRLALPMFEITLKGWSRWYTVAPPCLVTNVGDFAFFSSSVQRNDVFGGGGCLLLGVDKNMRRRRCERCGCGEAPPNSTQLVGRQYCGGGCPFKQKYGKNQSRPPE